MRNGSAEALIPATLGQACTRCGIKAPRDDFAGLLLEAPVASAPFNKHPMPDVMQ